MTSRLRDRVRQVLPGLYHLVRSARYAMTPERPGPETLRLLGALCGNNVRILSGPFEGLLYLPFASGSGLLPKVAGTYECELHGVIATCLSRSYRRFIDVGSGEGYYVAGFARACPSLNVLAIDMDPLARSRQRRLLALNNLRARVRILSETTPERLGREVVERTLILSDCEGAEDVLLTPDRAPGLLRADLLVEIHEFLVPGVLTRLIERFGASHRVQIIPATERDDLKLPSLEELNHEDRTTVLDEGRPAGMCWLWLDRKESR